MGAARLLPGVDEPGPLLEKAEGGPVEQGGPVRHQKGGPGLVVVFQEAQLAVIGGIGHLLAVHRLGVTRQGNRAVQIVPEHGINVIVIADVKGLIGLAVGQAAKALRPQGRDEIRVYRLRQPQAAGADALHRRPGLPPEAQRHQRRHIAAEAVHHGRPIFQRLNLIGPQPAVRIVQVDDIRPVPHPVAEGAVLLMVKPLGMLRRQHRVRGGVVVNHVDDAPHTQPVGLVHHAAKVVQRAVLRAYRPVVPDGVGTAQHALTGLLSNGVDGQQPNHVHPQPPDAGQIPPHPLEGSLRGVVAHKNGVDYLISPGPFRVFRHGAFLLHNVISRRAERAETPSLSRRFAPSIMPDRRGRVNSESFL